MSQSIADDFLSFNNVQKSYDQKSLVVKDFNLNVAKGEFLTLLGPSGSGKTTVLMMMAGFESVTSGDILLDGRSIARTAPNKRNIGMVFQNYALFPHMSIAENLAYPLKVRKMSGSEIASKVKKYLRLIEMEDFGNRTPGQLSGGQRQRVALARALIFDPTLVLMDEPLGALDKKLREQMQLEILRLHKQLGATVLYVTHDQTEALTMSDRIAVFEDGVVQQCAAPDTLYEKPANAFVADFIGENNFLSGKVAALGKNFAKIQIASGQTITAHRIDCGAQGTACKVAVRPESLFVVSKGESFDNSIMVKFKESIYVGDFIRYFFEIPGSEPISVKVLNDHSAPKFKKHQEVGLLCRKENCFAYARN